MIIIKYENSSDFIIFLLTINGLNIQVKQRNTHDEEVFIMCKNNSSYQKVNRNEYVLIQMQTPTYPLLIEICSQTRMEEINVISKLFKDFEDRIQEN